jgi:hypothetical protein
VSRSSFWILLLNESRVLVFSPTISSILSQQLPHTSLHHRRHPLQVGVDPSLHRQTVENHAAHFRLCRQTTCVKLRPPASYLKISRRIFLAGTGFPQGAHMSAMSLSILVSSIGCPTCSDHPHVPVPGILFVGLVTSCVQCSTELRFLRIVP